MDIRARVLARPDLNGLRAARDLDGLAAALNAEGVKVPQPRFVTARVVRTLPAGKEILAALKGARSADADIDLAYAFLMSGDGIDIGDATTLKLIDGLADPAARVLTLEQAGQLKSLAMVPLAVDRLQVEAALYHPDGREK